MSDFDREEERERLREKYERDQAKRQSTQRMSELLLRGATMTDSHCDDCGDPIFRYDGQEFCATCQAEGAPELTEETETPQADEASEAGATPASEPSLPAENGEASPADDRSEPEPATPEQRPPTREQRPPTRERAAPATDDRGRQAESGGGGLQTARDSLARTVARFARRAEETDQPREAANHLAAAREAAEALAALDRR
jgi:uncharacterized Zn finger protein (UPF0148 family)